MNRETAILILADECYNYCNCKWYEFLKKHRLRNKIKEMTKNHNLIWRGGIHVWF